MIGIWKSGGKEFIFDFMELKCQKYIKFGCRRCRCKFAAEKRTGTESFLSHTPHYFKRDLSGHRLRDKVVNILESSEESNL
ncbi:hypothetical protein NECAME_16716 [Necator americanus]|uniref:Uncharacterized protein n=1 Tax=Necator americanus TaxID=51031 RepID=W2TX43_NECAM|nr:hypothetical protein NECAME_16716 [Necator americanus]ETN85636.1 hypothetical protein NECAME_16716 [Necator americanus]